MEEFSGVRSKPRLRAQELDYLMNVDQADHIALVVCIFEEGGWAVGLKSGLEGPCPYRVGQK